MKLHSPGDFNKSEEVTGQTFRVFQRMLILKAFQSSGVFQNCYLKHDIVDLGVRKITLLKVRTKTTQQVRFWSLSELLCRSRSVLILEEENH